MRFEWDEEKAAANIAKHNVSFEDAITVFADPLYVIAADPDHSVEEARFIMMGVEKGGRLLIVSYTEREDGIRIISARMATPRERRRYEQEDL